MLPQDLLIRRLQAPDVHEILDIISDSRAQEDLVSPTEAESFDLATCNLFEYYRNRRSAYLVAVLDCRIVGGAGISRLASENATGCELQQMYLQRGKRGMGIGYSLLHRCLDLARELGYATCYAKTTSKMQKALRLYEREGFQKLCTPEERLLGGHDCQWHCLSLYSKSDAANAYL
jgi:putative acetyltransferase